MRNLYWTISILILMAVSFQNCGRQFSVTGDSRFGGDSGSKAMAGPDDPLVKKVFELSRQAYDGQRNLSEYTIDVTAGTVLAKLSDGSQVKKLLPTNMYTSVYEIFRNYNLCLPPELPPTTACTQVYYEPYAHLLDRKSGAVIQLGPRDMGCHSRTDFCDAGKSSALQSALQEVTSKLSTYQTVQ